MDVVGRAVKGYKAVGRRSEVSPTAASRRTPKVGAKFNHTHDQHEINFPHWANNGVPFHYLWTEEESKNRCFLRFSPGYYEEVARLRKLPGFEDRTVKDLPSYPAWRNDLESSDWIGQNLRAGKIGIVEDRFRPSMTLSTRRIPGRTCTRQSLLVSDQMEFEQNI
jgi:hypothetical protein